MREKLHFDSIREARGSYFVEYQPPVGETNFAILNVTFPNDIAATLIPNLMMDELRLWLSRYPVPIMASAWDDKDDLISPSENSRFLVGWIEPKTGEVVTSWSIEDLTNFEKTAPASPDWCTIYTDVSFRTDAEVKASADKSFQESRKQIRLLKMMLVLWLAVIPVVIAVVEFLGPEWLGAIVLCYSLWNALSVALRIWGWTRPSRKEEDSAEMERKLQHYKYHCEKNPEGFLRLKAENFERDARKRAQTEAAALGVSLEKTSSSEDRTRGV